MRVRTKLSIDARKLKAAISYLISQINLIQYFCLFLLFLYLFKNDAYHTVRIKLPGD